MTSPEQTIPEPTKPDVDLVLESQRPSLPKIGK